MASEKSILLCTVYHRGKQDQYDWVRANTRLKITYTIKRIHSFGLRFLKQNIPSIEILEYPTFEEYKKKLAEKHWDIVGFSFYLNEIHEILEMVKYARNIGIQELWAGNYGALTKGVEQHFDKIFKSYSEEAIAKELGHKITSIKHPPLINYLGTTIGLKLQAYGVLFTTRGCSIGCNYCQTPAFCPQPHNIPIESIEKVLRYYKQNNINEVMILDENFGILANHSKQVSSLLGKLGFYWYAMTKVNIIEKNLKQWMSNGFCGALIGIESLDQTILDSIGKKQKINQCIDLIKLMNKLHRMIIGYYMIGFEHETKESIKQTIRKVEKLRCDITQLCVLTPLPKTPQWNYIDDTYGIFDNDWHHYNAKHLVWNHPQITPKEMDRLLTWSFRICNPPHRPFQMMNKFYHMYQNLQSNGSLSGLRYFWKSQEKANRFDYFPKQIPLIK